MNAVARVIPGITFTDSFSLDTYDARTRRRKRRSKDQTPPQNNLNVPYKAKASLPGQDRSFLPGRNRDQEDPDGEMVEETLVGQLPEPPENTRYQLERDQDGSIVIVLVRADQDDPDLNTNDRTYKHRVFDVGADRILTKINRINRARHSRDASANIRRTIFRHVPLKPWERMELVTNPEGSVDVILITPVQEALYGEWPKGAQKLNPDSPEDENDVEMSAATGRRGERELPTPTFRDHRVGERQMLRRINTANRAYWAKR